MLSMILTIVYTVGFFVAFFMADMVMECDEMHSLVKHSKDEKSQMASSAIIFSLGSWFAVMWLWMNNKKEIMWTWKRWTTRK